MEQEKNITPWTPPNGPSSGKIARASLLLKELLRPGMTTNDVETATACANVILGETPRIHALESELPCNCGKPCAVVVIQPVASEINLNRIN